MTPRLVLASASPARLDVLRRAGLDPEVIVSGVDESQVTTENPAHLVIELARLKCGAVAASIPDRLVLGCDSVLSFDGEILGKPGDPDTARARWRQMRGRSGVLHTGHCLRWEDHELVRDVATVVHFADLSDREIDAYVATGEPLAVAGGFTIDGIGGAFIDRIEGDHLNVIGVSVSTVRTMVNALEAPVSWPDLWADRPSV